MDTRDHAPHRSGERLVRANGVELCVETFGDPADPPILLIMGAGASMLYWEDELCARLAAGRFVVRYDHRDTGRSATDEPGAPSYALPDLVADALGVLDVLGVARAHVVGMSMGAAIGQLLALDHPDRVASLTLLSSTPGGPGHEAPDLPPMSDALEALFAEPGPAPDWSDRAAVVAHLVEGERPFAGPGLFDEAGMRDLASRTVERTANVAAAANHFVIDPGEAWRWRLGDIAIPTLVVHGAEDPLFPLAHGHAVAQAIPGADMVVLPGMGHQPPPHSVWDALVPVVLRHTAGSDATL